jgi:hypothetical protein
MYSQQPPLNHSLVTLFMSMTFFMIFLIQIRLIRNEQILHNLGIILNFYKLKQNIYRFFFWQGDPGQPHDLGRNISMWMLLERVRFTLDGIECNKIGISYEAFNGQPNFCASPFWSCLHNQLWNFHEVGTATTFFSLFIPFCSCMYFICCRIFLYLYLYSCLSFLCWDHLSQNLCLLLGYHQMIVNNSTLV